MAGTALEAARRLLEQRDHERCFLSVKEHWLANPDDRDAVRLLAELMTEVGKKDFAEKLARLCASDTSLKDDAQGLFEVGFQFIDERQPELAAMLLERCARLAPDEPAVSYELGFALMSMKRYKEAITYFNRALARCDDFDTRLNLAVAYICTRTPLMAREMIERMASLVETDEEKKELDHQRVALARLESLGARPKLSPRDWLYVHYGSILLTESADKASGGKFGLLWNEYADVARQLVVLRGVLEGLGVTFDVVEHYSSLSRPLAHAMAELLGVPYELYKGPKRDERALLMMAWASDIIGPHESFIAHEMQRSIFAFGLTWREQLPVAPELIGCLAEGCAMPWSERWRVEQWDDGREPTFAPMLEEPEGPVEAAAKILDKVAHLEADADVLHEVQEIVAYYDSLRGRLLLGNVKAFPARPEYTNEIPV